MAIQAPAVAPSSQPHPDADLCPWCEQSIPHAKFLEIKARVASEERKKLAEVRSQHQIELQRQRVAVETEVRAAERKASKTKIADAERGQKAAEKALKDARQDQDRLILAARREDRAAFDKAAKDTAAKEKAANDALLRKMTDQIDSLQRQVDAQRAASLGEGADLDIAEALRGAFPGDVFARIGGDGANLSQRIVDGGRDCGSIVYDTRKHESWRKGYVSKIRKDQLAAKAECAIVASRSLPSGTTQVHVEGQVIVANPARVVAIAMIVRRLLIQLASVRMSLQDRAKKSDEMYAYIASDGFAQLLAEIDAATTHLFEIDVQEQSAHALVWRKRGQLIQGIVKLQGRIEASIGGILGTSGRGS
jgi:hypothetical protein